MKLKNGWMILLAVALGCGGQGAPAPATRPALPTIMDAESRAVATLLATDAGDDEHKAMLLTALLTAAPDLDTQRLMPSAPSMAKRIAMVVAIEPRDLRTAAWQIQALSLLPERQETRAAMEHATGVLLKTLKKNRAATRPSGGAGELSVDDLYLAVGALELVSGVADEVPENVWTELEKVVAPPDVAVERPATTAPSVPAVELMTLHQASAMAVTQLRIFDALHSAARKPGEDDKGIAPTLARVNALYKAHGEVGRAALSLSDLLLFMGQRRLAGVIWLPALNDELLKTQKEDGTWPALAGEDTAEHRMEATAQNLLALARCNAPIAICKFSYDGQWNGRPRDAANITTWLSDAINRPLRWQVVSVADDSAAWSAAPILFMTGKDDPHFAPDSVARLRDYAWRGGLILSSPDDRSGDFTTAILTHWAPAAFDNAYKPRELAEDHPLFSLWGKLSSPPRLEGISNGVRELWVHSRSDLGATWHGRRLNTRDQWTFAANLFLYTTGREKMRAPMGVPVEPAKELLALQMARVTYAGNWNPEPLLEAAMTEQAKGYGIDLRIGEFSPGGLDAVKNPVAHLTGAGAIHLSDAQVDALRRYMDAGGLLLVDAAGGDEAFASSFAGLVEKLAPGMKLEALPLNHLIYNGAIPGSVKMAGAHFRKGTAAADGHLGTPRLQACMDGYGRPRLIVSDDDLSCGILGITTWGISGYDISSARVLMRDLIVYAAHGGRTPATVPSAPNNLPEPR